MGGNTFCQRHMLCRFHVVLFLLLLLHQMTIDYGLANPVENLPKKTRDLGKVKENDLLEGDMIIDQTVWKIITNKTKIKNKRSTVTNGVKLWRNGIVPYTIDSRLGRSAKKAINDAINELKQKTCIRFQAKTNEYSYIRFIRGVGCYSYVGRVFVGRQSISLGSGCESKGVALHEMMHALGFFHTSSRTDRDAYVIVYENNVATGYLGNFKKYSHGQIDSFGSPYDITSIMHLPRDAFAKSRGLHTIQARAGASIILGQTARLTPVDSYQLNTLYKCASKSHDCMTALGLQSRVIRDTAMIASTSQAMFNPSQGRLHNSPSRYGNGAWCSYYNDKKPWIQVDLGRTIKVTGVATQGLLSFFNPAYVTKYEIEYRYYNRHWVKYQSWSRPYGNAQDLPGNWDETSVQFNSLTPTFNARYVRIIPRLFFGKAPCIRIEIYGCKI